MIAVVLLANGATMGILVWAFHSERYAPHLFRAKKLPVKAPMWERVASFNISSAISLAIVLGSTWYAYEFFFDPTQTSAEWAVASGVLSLEIYGFLYYGFHRAMHHKRIMRYVHMMHHREMFPSAFESLSVPPSRRRAA